MSPALRQATPDYSKVDGLRAALTAGVPAGVLALVAATFTTVVEIRVGTTSQLAELDTHLSGWDRHGPALGLLAALALALAAVARRGSRPAMAAIAVTGLATLALAVARDVPDLDRTGQVGALYADAHAAAGAGFYAEVAGGALLLAAGAGLLLMPAPGASRDGA